jgi:hypothetical protein
MKKSLLPLKGSPKAPAAGRGSSGPFSEAAPVPPEAGLPLIRQDVRQAIFCEDVPPLLQAPAESGDQLRNRRS